MRTDQLVKNGLVLAPYYACRQVGLPTDAIWKLGNFQIARLCDELTHKEAELKWAASQLVDALYELIKYTTESDQSNQLLTLKRAIYNSRRVDEQHVKKSLPIHLHTLFDNWSGRLNQLNETKQVAETAIGQSLAALNQAFGLLFGESSVQTAICHAQPELYRKLLELPNAQNLNSQQRKVLLSGTAYAYRMATKTSPFSYFTRTGCWPLNQDERTSPDQPSSVEEVNVLNIRIGQQLIDALLNQNLYSNKLPLLWNPASVLTEDGCYVLRTDLSLANNGATSTESTVAMSANPILFLVKDIFSERITPIDQRELVALLIESLACDEEKAQRILTKLLEYKLIIPTLGVDQNRLDWPAALAESPCVAHVSSALSNQLAGLALHVDSLAKTTPANRLNALQTLAQNSERVLASVGVVTPVGGIQKIVHNSVYLAAPPTPEPDQFIEQFPVFDSLLRVLPLFNNDYALQQWVAGRLTDTDTPLPALIFFHRLFESAIDADPNTLNENHPLLNPQALVTGNAMQQQITVQDRFVSEIASLLSETSEQLTLDSFFWAKWEEEASPFNTQSLPLSMTVMGQFTNTWTTDAPRFVVNKLFAGYGTMFTEPPLSARSYRSNTMIERQLMDIEPACEYADIIATMGFQGQIRLPVGRRSLYYPGQQVSDPARQCFCWDNLFVKRDAAGNPVLIEGSTGKRIVPLHRGTLASIYFPPFYRFLTTLGPSFTPDFSLYERLLNQAETQRVEGIRHYARIVSGGVVLMRRAWSVPLAEVPRQSAKQSDFAYYRQVRAWASEVSMPKEVFVIPMHSATYYSEDGRGLAFKRVHKPVYLNWDDYTSFRLFLRYTVFEAGRMSFIEALPILDRDKLGADNRVVEYQIEMYQNDRLP
ncbi:lantibiotic dehydratase [Spirosoma montaniterrae]|uniref:Lantibiotic dehydratase N-terminal domain-containing protein n=1 Tax=Spirosoma montaniterrae TaxID=1178516 RepID=A0A1P9WW20_9BACT|nr:lantibiotic dehydratase [Spirosoma montaniterrae]AQG79576.1 hypothetical protein AWR27_09710 [Spirosoma montaniterrae]